MRNKLAEPSKEKLKVAYGVYKKVHQIIKNKAFHKKSGGGDDSE